MRKLAALALLGLLALGTTAFAFATPAGIDAAYCGNACCGSCSK